MGPSLNLTIGLISFFFEKFKYETSWKKMLISQIFSYVNSKIWQYIKKQTNFIIQGLNVSNITKL